MDTYIALGSNLGNSEAEIDRARDFLQTLARSPVKCSSLWCSEPIDCPPGSPVFVNAVIGLELSAELSPVRLLDLLQNYEIRAGRPREHGHNLPRIIDLDIIYCRNEQSRSPRLTLPHPRAEERLFVMAPLAEIAPNLRLTPGSETAGQIAARLSATQKCRRLPSR